MCNLALKSLSHSSTATASIYSSSVWVRLPQTAPYFSPLSLLSISRQHSGKSSKGDRDEEGNEEWDEAWESVWIPEKTDKVPWELDKDASSTSSWPDMPLEEEDEDCDPKQFLHNVNNKFDQMTNLMKQITEDQPRTNIILPEEEKWNTQPKQFVEENPEDYTGSKISKDYRITKMRVHASLWLKEIEKQEEAKLGNPADDDIDKLLDDCSQFFDYQKLPNDPNFKAYPEGWEGVTKDEKPWEISQKEEDILLQEFERRMAFNKIQITNFIKSHVFSRRRPIDGWKHMIEVVGPNAKNRKAGTNKFVSEGPTNFDDNQNRNTKREIDERRR